MAKGSVSVFKQWLWSPRWRWRVDWRGWTASWAPSAWSWRGSTSCAALPTSSSDQGLSAPCSRPPVQHILIHATYYSGIFFYIAGDITIFRVYFLGELWFVKPFNFCSHKNIARMCLKWAPSRANWSKIIFQQTFINVGITTAIWFTCLFMFCFFFQLLFPEICDFESICVWLFFSLFLKCTLCSTSGAFNMLFLKSYFILISSWAKLSYLKYYFYFLVYLNQIAFYHSLLLFFFITVWLIFATEATHQLQVHL